MRGPRAAYPVIREDREATRRNGSTIALVLALNRDPHPPDEAGFLTCISPTVVSHALPLVLPFATLQMCRGRSEFRPLRRHKMQASSTEGSKGRMVLTELPSGNTVQIRDFVTSGHT